MEVIILLKTNLPVILLRGIVLLPHNEIRLEFDNEISKNIIELSELFHDNRILLVCDNSDNNKSLVEKTIDERNKFIFQLKEEAKK